MAGFAIPLIGAALGGLTGFLGNKDKTTTTTNTPTLSPLQQKLSSLFASQAQNPEDPDLSGYTSQGLQSINQTAAPSDKALDNNIASRGLSFSPIAAALKANATNSRIGQQSQFLNTVPLLKKQFDQQSFQNLLSSFSVLPTASTSTQKTPQSQLGGLFSGLGSGLFAGLGANNAH